MFFVGWPWLWFDPVGHLASYLGGTTNRAELSVWLWDHKYTDRTVPRYYALLTVSWTLQMKLMVLAFVGVAGLPPFRVLPVKAAILPPLPWTRREVLLVMEFVFPLLVFSLPGVPVYDVERLWLPAAPLFAVMAGRGGQAIWDRASSTKIRGVPLILLIMIAGAFFQVYTLVRVTPCFLSHYSGADSLDVGETARAGAQLLGRCRHP